MLAIYQVALGCRLLLDNCRMEKGFYQMHVDIEELNGKLKYRYQFF
jgi:hypothetical protein